MCMHLQTSPYRPLRREVENFFGSQLVPTWSRGRGVGRVTSCVGVLCVCCVWLCVGLRCLLLFLEFPSCRRGRHLGFRRNFHVVASGDISLFANFLLVARGDISLFVRISTLSPAATFRFSPNPRCRQRRHFAFRQTHVVARGDISVFAVTHVVASGDISVFAKPTLSPRATSRFRQSATNRRPLRSSRTLRLQTAL